MMRPDSGIYEYALQASDNYSWTRFPTVLGVNTPVVYSTVAHVLHVKPVNRVQAALAAAHGCSRSTVVAKYASN